jgi:hypothetical protein
MRGMMATVTGARERQLETLERLRGSVRVTLRARRWLVRWRATSPLPWDAAESTTMIANAVELSALTEFVAMHRAQGAVDED